MVYNIILEYTKLTPMAFGQAQFLLKESLKKKL